MSRQLAVVNGAILKCEYGTAPSPLTVTTNLFVLINNRQVATVGDNTPMVNVFPFGVCLMTGKPCIPLTQLPWYPGGTGIPTGSPFLILPKNSILGCMIGGFIEVTDAAQVTVFVDAPQMTITEVLRHNLALLEERETRARRAAELEQFLAETDAAIEADDPGGLGKQLLNTVFETGKELIGDDPAEIGSNFIPWKKLAELRHLKNLPGALKDTWKAIRGRRGAATPRNPPIHKPKLPPTTEASIKAKLNDYLLNPEHSKGGAKAKWFKEALGYDRSNLGRLAEQIKFDPAHAVKTAKTPHGSKYYQRIRVEGANGRQIDVGFVWIQNKDGVTRLVTSIPTKK